MTDQSSLSSRLAAAPWHTSNGYDRDDGSRVGIHQYLLAKDGPDVAALISDLYDLIQSDDPHIWRGRYQGRSHVYRYLTLGEWTYWHMGGKNGLNRANDVDRNAREVRSRRRSPGQRGIFDGP